MADNLPFWQEICYTAGKKYTIVHMRKDSITDFFLLHRRFPSYREAAAHLGLKSKNSITRLMKIVLENGLVEQDEAGRLTPTIPLLSSVVIRELSARKNFSDALAPLEMLRVKTETLLDAGIVPYDMLCFQRSPNAQDGDLVIAKADGKTIIRFYQIKDGIIRLAPKNKKFRSIRPKELKILGIVRGLIRSF
jgi:repressor LexA